MEKIGNNVQTNNLEKETFKPIRACIIDLDNIDDHTQKIIGSIRKNGVNVDFSGSKDFYKKNKIDNKGDYTYAISDISNQDKFSNRYRNCTGIIAVGEDVKIGEQISFMSHQYPEEILKKHRHEFVKDLVVKIQLMKKITKSGSIDVVMFGGNTTKNDHYIKYKEDYGESVDLINKTLKKNFDISLTVIIGPADLFNSQTSVYLDTSNRRLYILREFQKNNKQNHEYLADDFDEQEKKWD